MIQVTALHIQGFDLTGLEASWFEIANWFREAGSYK